MSRRHEPVDFNDPLTALMISRGEIEESDDTVFLAQGCSRAPTTEHERYVPGDLDHLGAAPYEKRRLSRH